MKKIFNLLMIVGLVSLTACDPMEDIYNEIDGKDNPVVGDATYTLTEEDYSALKISSFDSKDAVKEAMPAFLAKMFPVWGKGSSVLLGYNLNIGDAEGVADFTDAEVYKLALLDYPRGDEKAEGFLLENDAEALIVDLLTAKYDAPTEGDIKLVKYKNFTEVPVFGVATIFEAGFNGDLSGFEKVSVSGTKEWYFSKYNDTQYAKMSGYKDGVNEDWLISTEIDLTKESDVVVQVDQLMNHATDLTLLSIVISKNYDGKGDPATADWDLINFTTVPVGDSYDYVMSENLALTSYEGETIHIAFKYTSTETEQSTWQINNLEIKTPGVTGATVNKELYYTYTDGAWVISEGVYYLSAADYDSMGENYGQPGKYNNFDSSSKPDNYIPTFLNKKYAFAQEGDALIIVYKYYSKTTPTRGNLYTVVDGMWVGHESVVAATLQFGHDGNLWVPDNTIKYTLVSADYELVGNGKYSNFDVRAGKDDEKEAVRLEKFNKILNKNFPNAAEAQKYLISYSVYNGSNLVWSMKVIKKDGVYIIE
ncbi:MAG: hypothetical protein COB98_05325 [Flavobacteriaceae bacterium]|nr:MAG: hypothetical protein COB98_05325 [Flavobacteriaceae bacterium]